MKPSTERDYHRRIARVIEAILADPSAPHTVESLAAVAHLSPFHFHRIYRALTGESIVETVQRVRLAQAAHRLTVAGDSVTTVAGKVGYESPQAFARAFRGFAGVSPSTFQMRQRRLSAPHASGPRIAEAAPAATGANLPCVEMVELAPIEVLCLRHDGPTATISQTFRTLWQLLGCTSSEALAQGAIGICSGDPEEHGSFRYLAAIVRSADMPVASALETVRIEGGLYASHRLVGPYALIAPTFQALFGGWLPQSGYEPADRPALEFYRSRPAPRRQPEYVTDLLIPVRKD
ncbi:MAG: GyrI-like domain-containing protein [Paraburkholderia sp.]|jgi:AraC family transcriptional regulator|nr:GyrI-like domain-containing protein [Burkholderia sp. 4M9327F10]